MPRRTSLRSQLADVRKEIAEVPAYIASENPIADTLSFARHRMALDPLRTRETALVRRIRYSARRGRRIYREVVLEALAGIVPQDVALQSFGPEAAAELALASRSGRGSHVVRAAWLHLLPRLTLHRSHPFLPWETSPSVIGRTTGGEEVWRVPSTPGFRRRADSVRPEMEVLPVEEELPPTVPLVHVRPHTRKEKRRVRTIAAA